MTKEQLLKIYLDSYLNISSSQLEYLDTWAHHIFILETQHGLPSGIAFDKLQEHKLITEKGQQIVLMHKYLSLCTEHKTKSHIGEKGLKRLQETNNKRLIKLIENNIWE